MFVESQYTVKTTESERIGIDHAAGANVSGKFLIYHVIIIIRQANCFVETEFFVQIGINTHA